MSHELEKYIAKYKEYDETMDQSEKDAIYEELCKIWYHYLSPADKEAVRRMTEADHS